MQNDSLSSVLPLPKHYKTEYKMSLKVWTTFVRWTSSRDRLVSLIGRIIAPNSNHRAWLVLVNQWLRSEFESDFFQTLYYISTLGIWIERLISKKQCCSSVVLIFFLIELDLIEASKGGNKKMNCSFERLNVFSKINNVI